MTKKKRIVLCCFLVVCVVILLFVGIQEKNRKENKILDKSYYVNNQKFEFDDSEYTEISISLESDVTEITVLLPEKNSAEEKWILENRVNYQNNIEYSSDGIRDTAEGYFREITIGLCNHDLDTLSFMLIKTDTYFDAPYSHNLVVNLDFEEEPSTNAFKDDVVLLEKAVYYPRTVKDSAYIEIPVTKKSETLSDDEYRLDIMIYYNEGEYVRYRDVKWNLNQSSIIQYIGDDDIEKLEENIKNGNARIKIDISPVLDNHNTFISSLMITENTLEE